jgi:epoxyqueuosine reductase
VKQQIQEWARALGFDDCRVTTAQPPDNAAHFERWLAAQHHGTMAYLERNAHKRVDPERVLAGARSIITLAASYHLHQQESGPVARYARFSDYHDVLGERLKNLTGYLNELGGPVARSLWYIDTGPLLERDLAQRSGLGFIGKHTNLISRQLGNWIFLAEIITTLELEPDGPEVNRCGSCTRCISACPTQAIRAPFELDARRCISYLTIELKGPIPEEFRPAIGNRVYGCDDCLAVCPWNRFAREGRLMKDHLRIDLSAPDLVELLSLDDAGFKKRFANTPMLRTKRRGFLRNVCVALGNVGNRSALPALERASSDSEPLIAEHARWAAIQIKKRS